MKSSHLSNLVTQSERIQITEEVMWTQRDRVKWLQEGDNNTRFFHHTTNRRRSKNYISPLEENGGGTI